MPEAALSRLALYAARPTIRINGDEKERVSGLVIGMEMIEQQSGLSSLEVRFSNVAADGAGDAEFAFEDEQSLKLGDRIAVYSGEEEAPTEIFSGLITAFEADFPAEQAPTLTVLAEDALQQARMKRRTRLHEEKSIKQLAESIAEEHGLDPRVDGFTDTLDAEFQFNESDLAFLRRLLERYDGDVQVVENELHVAPRDQVRRGTVELELHSQLIQARVLADLAHQVTGVTLTGWDPARGQRVVSRSSGRDRGPGSGRTGSEILNQTLGARVHHLSHVAVSGSAEGDAVATAAYDGRFRRFVRVNGIAEGNPSIRVGTHVELTGLGPRFSNTYYVLHCCHRFDLEKGYETDFVAESAFLGRP